MENIECSYHGCSNDAQDQADKIDGICESHAELEQYKARWQTISAECSEISAETNTIYIQLYDANPHLFPLPDSLEAIADMMIAGREEENETP